MKFKRKLAEIEAIQWTGKNRTEIEAFCPDIMAAPGTSSLLIANREEEMRVDIGDWIIRGVDGECYPCKPDIFERTYSACDTDEPAP